MAQLVMKNPDIEVTFGVANSACDVSVITPAVTQTSSNPG